MAAQGSCPSCGADIQFRIGASVTVVCRFCNTTVRRTDRGLENLGKVADIVDTPAIVAVGDSGSYGNTSFWVLGSVLLAHDMGGEWTEWYVCFQDGKWGWLAYAQGMFMLTWKVDLSVPIPLPSQVRLDTTIRLGSFGDYRVVECKKAKIVSAQGELPITPTAGDVRYYADLHGPSNGFGTIDWGNGSDHIEVFLGREFPESQLQINEQSERPHKKVSVEGFICPNCGASLNLRGGRSIEHIACEYCRAIFDSESKRIVAQQQEAALRPKIPLGSVGGFGGQSYTVIGFLEKLVIEDGETYTWSEYLLYGAGVGFRWIVASPGKWYFVTPLNAADVSISEYPRSLVYTGRRFTISERSEPRTTLVLGEFYWKVAVGETSLCADFSCGNDILSREEGSNEVHYSYAAWFSQADIAKAFGIEPKQLGPVLGWKPLLGCLALLAMVSFFVLIGMCTCADRDTSPGVRTTPGSGWSSGK